MKLITYRAGGKVHIGKTDGVGISRLDHLLDHLVTDLTDLIADWEHLEGEVAQAQGQDDAIADVELLAPILRPGKILGLGMNYADHVREAGMEIPADQIWFTKAVTSVNGPFAPIQLPRVSTALDYECELVFIIGKRCRHVSVEDAPGVIFGYCAGNDVSVRDWQLKTSQFMLGKSFDTHAPFGPWIVTPDDIDPLDLPIRTLVNGETRQSSNTRNFIFTPAAQIAHLSQAMTLEPGDVIFTGTPGGVGAAMKPPQFLKAGDVVRVEIDGIGAIENRVEPEGA
ncbi:fumarylacetoacetate hydrolase family protein [Sphingobium aquiterrae]|uniref:fumarylacetoacetate hydrolase family protein n=1 Tax=Sphingobium aquiterrae TaxID=2038656 RepID=UPI00301B5682